MIIIVFFVNANPKLPFLTSTFFKFMLLTDRHAVSLHR